MKYNGELSEPLLNVQRIIKMGIQTLREKQADKATVDKSIIRERRKLREKQQQITLVIKSCAKRYQSWARVPGFTLLGF